MAQLSDNDTVDVGLVCEGEMSVSDECGSSWPVVGCLEIGAIDEFELIKDLRFIGVMVHCVDDDTSFSIEGKGSFIDIYYDQ